MDADALVARVHERLGGVGMDLQTFGSGAIEARWKRYYGHCGLSDERFTTGQTFVEVLQDVLRLEDEADANDMADPDRCRDCFPRPVAKEGR